MTVQAAQFKPLAIDYLHQMGEMTQDLVQDLQATRLSPARQQQALFHLNQAHCHLANLWGLLNGIAEQDDAAAT